jgi:hypothetical protein
VIAQFRAELLKQRSIRTNGVLFATMLGQGETLGTLFAALFGAMSVTGEFRHGTIRPVRVA